MVNIVWANTLPAVSALQLVRELQDALVQGLVHSCKNLRFEDFESASWLRNEGRWGGGTRFGLKQKACFSQASVNVSQVQYNDRPDLPLSSATALSSIIHPSNPYAPSLHIHISWTERKNGKGSWRLMADLNPSIPSESDRKDFDEAIREISTDHYANGIEQGDRYFYIPNQKRSRGVFHFYLEDHNTGDFRRDLEFAREFGRGVCQSYCEIIKRVFDRNLLPGVAEFQKQLDYHSLYFYQVLTLDRGTVAGLLVHDENDLGVMGSLPKAVNLKLLRSWLTELPPEDRPLLHKILECFPPLPDSAEVDETVRASLARALRAFYLENPSAMDRLAKGSEEKALKEMALLT
jgi:coproporphyrinogen III oxidase